jgi:hypothetical protein
MFQYWSSDQINQPEEVRYIMKANNLFKTIPLVVLVLLVSAACSPVLVSSTSGTTEPEVNQGLVEPPAAPTQSDDSSQPVANQSCSYDIDLPDGMTKQQETEYSATYSFENTGTTSNFIYISVIDANVMELVANGSYENEVYNYDPAETELLLTMPVGETIPVREVGDTAEWFTYERLADVQIAGHYAQAYENLQPWEFPEGTKEIRYYIQLDDCTLLIGAYLVSVPSDQPGIITEELFNEVIGSLQLSM